MTTKTMRWDKLLSSARFGEQQGTLAMDLGRTPFHKDYDRIIFSSAFRRLDRKTQVHPLSENDHVHSRLTHSLEVACVGRSLGTRVGQALGKVLPDFVDASDIGALVQAACLAHDIGNPPYGHTGEDAIRHWFLDRDNAHFLEGLSELEQADLQTFEGNAQGLRIVTQVESHRFDGGMRLTYGTLGAFLKYPWTVDYVVRGERKKFGCYQTELPLMREVANALGLIQTGENAWCRHPLVYLLEAADDICYGLIDLEDGIEMGLLNYQEVEDLLQPLLAEQWHEALQELDKADNTRRRLQMLRGQAMEAMVSAVSSAFVHQHDNLLAGELKGDIIDYCPANVQQVVHGAKKLARERIFNDSRKLAVEVGSYATLSILLDAFLRAVRECVLDGQATFRNKRVLELMGRSAPKSDWTLYQAYMRALDFIAGMTDNYAAEIARQFSGYQPPNRN
ncbi:deoxyguanosinetriphosphate triphosphohydrolase [Thalassolituus oleivorans]|jgi:dGTPase|uniref:Deoxyguanosinetriphosphate triphosphohydrolase n=2 Tax=root TaxID=1 RepID=M5E1W8_9GAMM|nr:deoxyguanosinetriphosphate triphosphohydrolase [Thalassolituus oleivorans]CCU71544.1 deoxyguanosinetriphosphate triphosphohydrolase [Thalassolituus oleivorans MIL-1]